jgi:hypothetical protein
MTVITAGPRQSGWRPALMQYLGEVARSPLVFGTHDCALFAAGAVQAMTGTDFAAAYRGKYSTLDAGLRLLRRDGFADHAALARSVLPVISAAQAMPGDLAIIPLDPLPALGVVQGAGIYVLDLSGNLGLLPLTDAIEALRV